MKNKTPLTINNTTIEYVCDHNHGLWSWRTKTGLTAKCKRCGMIQHYKYESNNGYREFTPGLATLHPDGSQTVELIEVTSYSGGWKATDEWHFFRR